MKCPTKNAAPPTATLTWSMFFQYLHVSHIISATSSSSIYTIFIFIFIYLFIFLKKINNYPEHQSSINIPSYSHVRQTAHPAKQAKANQSSSKSQSSYIHTYAIENLLSIAYRNPTHRLILPPPPCLSYQAVTWKVVPFHARTVLSLQNQLRRGTGHPIRLRSWSFLGCWCLV